MKYVMYGKGIVGNAMVKLLEFVKYEFVWMDDADKDDEILRNADKIIITAGISPKHEIYQTYSEKMMGELDLCWQILDEHQLLDQVHFYCVTGTNGKSTVSWVLFNALKQLFNNPELKIKNSKLNSHINNEIKICGNFEPAVSEVVLEIVRNGGQSVFHLVVEISSFMCYQIRKFKSDDSIITNLAVDHINWHADLDDYRLSKIRLFEHTKYTCITNKQVSDFMTSKQLHSDKLNLYDGIDIDIEKTNFIGKHNAANLAAVYALTNQVANRYELTRNDEIFYNSMKTIDPLDNRCKRVAIIDGIQIIDDLHATSSHAQAAAFGCVEGKLILICGGFDKGDDYNSLKALYKDKIEGGIIIGKEGKPFEALFKELGIEYIHTQDMKVGLEAAIDLAKKHTIKTILYSPGAASFDLFKNRKERALTFDKELKLIL